MKYSGRIGYSRKLEVSPGVWEDIVVEINKIGDVVQRTEAFTSATSILPEYRTTTSVSVLSDGVLVQNYQNLLYVTYMGIRWTIASAVQQPPRMVLYLGEEYHGPSPSVP